MTDDHEIGLPIKFGPCSNGEYDPQPLSPVVRETIRLARDACDTNARRTGMGRRQFLRSVCGAATTLLMLNACAEEAARSKRRKPGGRFDLPTTSTTDPDAARAVLAGDEFVFDAQCHFLEYRDGAGTPVGRDFWSGFPQRDCGEGDPRACFSIAHFFETVFVESDTSMVILSALPIAPEGSPMSAVFMDEARRNAEAFFGDERVLIQSQALPNVGDLAANLDAMAAAVETYPIVAWKVFTNYPDLYEASGNAWRLDDGDPALAQVGAAFVEHAVRLGVPIITAHKGLSGTQGYNSPHASPIDFGPSARDHPDATFVAYHSGYEAAMVEVPYTLATAGVGANRLITSMINAGIGPNQNIYAELGTSWWSVMSSPDQAAHLIGKLLKYVGEDNVLWGTDSLFYGAPQDQIQAFRAFQISEEFQARFGYPALTDEVKRKVLGLNALRLHDVNPVNVPAPVGRAELEQLRAGRHTAHRTFGPRTPREVRAHIAAHHGLP
ncbi:MAG: amidohydrolase family protein [Acidimicrobiia bacterium]